MATLKELINERVERLESVPSELLTAIEANQLELFNDLLSQISQLDTKRGNFIINSKNLALIDSIVSNLKKSMFDGKYVEALDRFITEYNKQTGIINSIVNATFNTFSEKQLYEQARLNSIEGMLLLFDQPAAQVNLFTPLRSILYESVSSGSGFEDTVRAIREFMLSDNENLGNYMRYSRQVAFDAFAVSDRTYANVIHEDIGVLKYEYFGGTLPKSRCFCIERQGKVWSKEQLQQWGRRENIGSCEVTLKSGRKGWKGINDATNEKTIFNYLGGWNCIHALIAVSPETEAAELEGEGLPN